MTKFSMFDKIEQAKKYMGLFEVTKFRIFDNIEELEKSTPASQKMTKLSIFDKIEEAKKSTGLSENDNIEPFWQNSLIYHNT